MIKLNLFAISGIFITVTYLPLCFFLFLKGKSYVARLYAIHITMALLWGIGFFMIATETDPSRALIIWKFAYTAVLFLPVFFCHFVNVFTAKKGKILVFLAYIQALIFTHLLFTNKMMTSVQLVFNEFYIFNNSSLYTTSFILWEIIVSYGTTDLIRHMRKSSGEEKKSTFMLIYACGGFIGGTNNFLTCFNNAIYPFGNVLIPFHSFGISYAIFKHRLFDLEFVFRKSLIYSVLLTVITLFYLVFVTLIERLIQTCYGYSSLVISTLIILIIGILFIPLRNTIQKIIDYLFYRKSATEIFQENELLKQEIVQTDRLRSIATFASGMAHEIKNPLTSIKTFCEYLPTKIHDKNFLDTFIPLVNKDADRINELIHDLLEYAKPSPPLLIKSDIHKIIESVMDALNSKIIAHKVQIVRDYDPVNIPPIPVDAKQMKQALLNIMLNSVEAMSEGGTLALRTCLSHQEKLNIMISDNGSGIAPDDLLRIFDPFFTKKEKGTGMGLSITHGIIKEHGGKIFVESKIELGTTFRIELPYKT